MPIYEYRCECGKVFEVFRPVNERDDPAECPDAWHYKDRVPGHDKVARVVSKTSFQLAGGGWFKDGYSGGNKS